MGKDFICKDEFFLLVVVCLISLASACAPKTPLTNTQPPQAEKTQHVSSKPSAAAEDINLKEPIEPPQAEKTQHVSSKPSAATGKTQNGPSKGCEYAVRKLEPIEIRIGYIKKKLPNLTALLGWLAIVTIPFILPAILRLKPRWFNKK